MRRSSPVGFTSPLICAMSIVVIATFAIAGAAESTSPAFSAAIKSLFAESWEKSADGLSAAERHHRAAKAATAADPRADYSLALVQWRYLRYTDALRTLDQLIAAVPDYLPAARARIYLLVLMKKSPQALAQCEALGQLLADKFTSAEHAAARRETVEFLGRMLGYFEGPAASTISQSAVADVRGRLLEQFSTDDREAFAAAFSGVRDRFLQLDDDKRRTQDTAKVEQQEQKEQDLQRLGAERASVEADKKLLQDQAVEAQQAAQVQVDQIDRQMAPLENEYARINAQGAIMRNQLGQLDLTISDLLAQADATDDPVIKNSLIAQANGLSVQARRVEIDYQTLDNQAAQVLARRNALLQQRSQIVGRYEAEAKRLGVQAAKLGKNEQRISVETKKALKAPSGVSPQVQNKTATTASITSYVEAPLERERLRVLASLE